ncbi:MAG: hypothetical protein ACFHWX_00490 [Bacteroidota bacterium]
MEVTIHGFIKVGDRKHVIDLMKNGTIYANTVEYFRKIESAEKKDVSEGANASLKINVRKILIENRFEIPYEFSNAKLNTYNDTLNNTHLYCMYGVKPEHITGKPFIDERILKFGDAALVITNPKEFIKRVEQVASKYSLNYKPVTYYNPKNDFTELSIFNKPDTYEHQNEFRLHFGHSDPEPLTLKIGSIEDISHLIASKDLLMLYYKYH